MNKFAIIFVLFQIIPACVNNIPTDFKPLFVFVNEYWDGDGFYPFPEGTYVKYKPRGGESKRKFKPDSLLRALTNNGVEIKEAWDIISVKIFSILPGFYYTLKG